MDRTKLGQITASKPGKKKQCRWGAIVVWPILGDVAACARVGLDCCLNLGEMHYYWHYFANYFNAIFITALNNKPKIFVTEEEDVCLVSSRTPKHSRSHLSSPRSSLVNELLPTACSLFLPCPPPFPSWTSSRESSLCYQSGRWWTITPSSSLMHPMDHAPVQWWVKTPSPIPPAGSGPRAGLCLIMFQGSSAQKRAGDLQPLRWYHHRI